ncbi:hypothetical protein LINPERHAP2_LOCUS5306 [Linum perenne]
MQTDSSSNPRCPVISFSEEEILSFYKPWSKAIVVKVLEKAFTFPVIKRRLEYLWAKARRIQVSDLANNFYMVRFSEEDDYQRVLFDGPWKISVERIGNRIGRTVRLDLATAEGSRARYARVYVEVDLSRPLLGKYMIEDKVFLVEYESLDNICFACGLYGHKEEECKPAVSPDEVAPPAKDVVPIPPENADGDSGSWMTVKRRHRKPSATSGTVSQPNRVRGSRFEPLGVEEVIEPIVDVSVTSAPINQGINSDTSALAVSLKAVLDKATNSGKSKNSGPSKIKALGKSQKPLSDVTNNHIKKKGQGAKLKSVEVENGEGLVSVPVMFANPVFQSSATGQKPQVKQKLSSGSTPASSRAPSATKVKKFGPKLPVACCSQPDPRLTQSEPSKDGSGMGGRPPDTQ